MMEFTILAELNVPADKVGAFKACVESLSEGVRKKERGATLFYDFFTANDDSTRCVVLEIYKDVHSYLDHHVNFATGIAEIIKLFTIERVTVLGDAPAEVIAGFRSRAGDKFHYYGGVLSRLSAD